MNVITHWDPFRDMIDFRRMMNQLRRNFQDTDGQEPAYDIAMDVCETPEAFEIEAALPGVSKDDVDITLNDNILTIRAETKGEKDEKGKTYHTRELRVGSFVRSIVLPSSINADAIEANFDNGILKLRLPRAEESKPKRIQIHSGNVTKMNER
ncbi:MAG: Hsp20/alpha crystallin family protein [Syntrophales bacterium]